MKLPVLGSPDMENVSTGYLELQNLSIRMRVCRFTRLTKGLSKTAEHNAHAVSLCFMFFNFCRAH